MKSSWFWALFFLLLFILLFAVSGFVSSEVFYERNDKLGQLLENLFVPLLSPLDKVAYNQKLNALANNPPPPEATTKTVKTKNKQGEIIKSIVTVPPPPTKPNLWPVQSVYPSPGAILPFKRIVAYYGNLYSKGMGVLGEYPEEEMLQKLDGEVNKWNVADPATPTIPALHYVAVVAQGSKGDDGKYRLRMPDTEIDKVLKIAAKIDALVFLDMQVGFSNLQIELPLLEKYFKMPQVHLGIDPEFSMKTGIKPGKIVGTFDAEDINFAANYLAKVVRENKLTPKMLVVHRYTQKMVTNYKKIEPLPEVQIVMNMDGWGQMAKKISTYQQFIYKEPVLFTGFKLFYKNDVLQPGSVIMTPEQILKLNPQPIYVQYQ